MYFLITLHSIRKSSLTLHLFGFQEILVAKSENNPYNKSSGGDEKQQEDNLRTPWTFDQKVAIEFCSSILFTKSTKVIQPGYDWRFWCG